MVENGVDYARGRVSQIVISAVIALGLALVTAIWSLADPRAEIRTIRETYLTLREHNEYREGIKEDIHRLESRYGEQITRAEVEQVWKLQADELKTIHLQLEELRRYQREHDRDDRTLARPPHGGSK